MSTKPMLPGSKWLKHSIIARSAELRKSLPDSALYSYAQLERYLNRYKTVFVKPTIGGGGHNIFCVKRLEEGGYLVKMERKRMQTSSLRRIHDWITESARQKHRTFMIQQGIDLALWRGRPVDLRTIVQKNHRGDWEVTGMFSKIAGKDLAITNVSAGGTAHSVEEYLTALGYKQTESQAILRSLNSVSLGIARQFGRTYGNATYGLDIGLDRQGKLLLIEANTVPRIDIFLLLKMPRSYARAKKLWDLYSSANDMATKKYRGRQRAEREQRR
ncbi:YheC/YheD family protein [Tumebacillus permanentifrigoris]|uniref:YheC/D-like protein n=1 Tax=Tumebacillus permanentifrigoris TaxID=378543 RepID=A0A316D8B6_9BACL|nr:YheC/YheD family protein [Tumebacillus permanentifrigoris]PWK12817.1 YheC/D-like protein [Tumebacillus permanentifrigoris]